MVSLTAIPTAWGNQPPPTKPTGNATAIDAADPSNTPTPIPGLHAQEVTQGQLSTLGSTDPDSGYMLQADLTYWGAALRHVRLSHYTQSTTDDAAYVVQQPIEATSQAGQALRVYPMAARFVTVNGTPINLETVRWELIQPGAYRIRLVDDNNQPVLQIERRYSIDQRANAYDILCRQRFENLGTTPLRVTWHQYAHGDLPNDDAAYLGDRRMLVAGYQNTDYDPSRRFIYTDNASLPRSQVLKGEPFWPNEDLPVNRHLVWVAAVNRYFAAAVHPVVPTHTPSSDANTHLPAFDEDFPQLGIQVIGQPGTDNKHDPRQLVFTLASRPLDLAPGDSDTLDLSLFAGPRENGLFTTEPYDQLGFSNLIVYSLGGPCAFCTFQWLAHGLLGFLKFLHLITFDWGVSIIILVLVVRAILHPITKKSQVNMMKMGKQMQALQPELEKLKKKYKDDSQKYQQEQLKLMREKGVNPANMLGCLPMLLQTPIWIALYAMLYFAIELRHEPAFYSLFQAVSGGRWGFLGDLSRADNFLQFAGKGFTLNLLFIHPTFASINLIPLLMAVVFFIQQKFTQPPPASEQAAQQQKIMGFMVLLFPIMLYSAPSGLTLYILASTFAGIVDSYLVRKHIKEQEEAGTLFDKKPPPKPGGLMHRMQQALEAKQRQMVDQQQTVSRGSNPRRSKKRPRKP